MRWRHSCFCGYYIQFSSRGGFNIILFTLTTRFCNSWRNFNKKVTSTGEVGFYHETFIVQEGQPLGFFFFCRG
ncbi:monooxygenase family protein [Effusibacillus lacus]|uniref:monooxygenase family protein n=1 Tax=Effusibacillus lacus TaxID=1348429 RepID=UPI0014047445